ncbi:DUF5011 domain-containing protein, partial [bacterium]|nr:DUF5011 domain-containing protein [bacterium]
MEHSISESIDDGFFPVPLPENIFFNGSSTDTVWFGSNSYIFFDGGSTEYSDLTFDNPARAGISLCANDHSYQRLLYRTEAGTNNVRVRYEGVASTSGDIGLPEIVYEAIFYEGESYFDLHVGHHAACNGDLLDPEIRGRAAEGYILTASRGTWSYSDAPLDFSYQWLRYNNDTSTWDAIAGATNSQYLLTSDDIDSSITVEVLASHAESGSTTRTAEPTSPVTEVHLISTCEELQASDDGLHGLPSDVYRLTNNINCTGVDMDPLWPSGFSGVFDGNEHTISGISLSGADNTALFSNSDGAEFFDLTLSGSVSSTGHYTGALVGEAYNTSFSNITSTVEIYAGANHVGGIAGFAHYDTDGTYTLSDLSVEADIYLPLNGSSIGGIFGYLGEGIDETEISVTIDNAQFVGSISGDAEGGYQLTDVGGLIGLVQIYKDNDGDHHFTIQNSSTAGSGIFAFFSAGGLVGRMVSENYTTSFTRERSPSTISLVSSSSSMPIQVDLGLGGGLVGNVRMYNEGVSDQRILLDDTSATGDITGGIFVGGLLGTIDVNIQNSGASNTLDVTDSFASGDVVGSGFVGGFLGGSYEEHNNIFAAGTERIVTFTNTYATGAVSGSLNSDDVYFVGGFAGFLYCTSSDLREGQKVCEIHESYASGDVTGNLLGGSWNVGGFFGALSDSVSIRDSYAEGNVSGYQQVGGFAGVVQEAYDGMSIERIYSSGMVASSELNSYALGGLFGYTDNTSITLRNAFTTSPVVDAFTGATQLGMCIGSMGTETLIENTEYVAGSYSGSGGGDLDGCTSVEEESYFYASDYSLLSLWDFSTVWRENPDLLPTLRASSEEIGDTTPPTLSLIEPTADTLIVDWDPSVDWDDSAACSYSYNDITYLPLDCSQNGADIPAPETSSEVTLYILGADDADNETYEEVTFTFADLEDPHLIGATGTGFTYTHSDIPFDWETLTESATSVGFEFDDDDEMSEAIPLSFPFTFYGNTYEELFVSTNGFVTFTDGQSATYDPLAQPDFGIENDTHNVIALNWTDLYIGEESTVRYEVFGTAPNRHFVLEYLDVEQCCNENVPLVTMQLHLYETTHVIEMYILESTISPEKLIVQGVIDSRGTQAVLTPNRNATLSPSLSEDAVRFTPSSAPNYVRYQDRLTARWDPTNYPEEIYSVVFDVSDFYADEMLASAEYNSDTGYYEAELSVDLLAQDRDNLLFSVRVTDIYDTTTSLSSGTYDVDTHVPDDYSIENIEVFGGTVNSGELNETNTSVSITVALPEEGSLIGGKIYLFSNNDEDDRWIAVEDLTEDDLGTNKVITLTASELYAIPLLADWDFLEFYVVLQDNAGNSFESDGERFSLNLTNDTIFPSLSLNGGNDVYITTGELYEELGATAEDTVDGDISDDVQITGTIDTSREAEFSLDYLVENSRGATSRIITREVIVLPEDSSEFYIGNNQETHIHVSQTSTAFVQFTDLWSEGDPSFITAGSAIITAQSDIGVLEIVMPSDMIVTPSGDFDGSMMLPRALTEEDLEIPSGAPLHAAFEIGLSESSLLFDRGVRILFPGQGNRLAGTQHLGVFTPISTVCDADTQGFADTLPDGGDCAITVGEDLVVWTKHFSAFAAYGEGGSDDTPAPRSSNARRYSWRQSPQKSPAGCQ